MVVSNDENCNPGRNYSSAPSLIRLVAGWAGHFRSSKFLHLQTRSCRTPITSWSGIESHVPYPCTSGRLSPCALPVRAHTFPHPGFRVSPTAPSAYPRLMKQPGEAGDFFFWRRVDRGDRYRLVERSHTSSHGPIATPPEPSESGLDKKIGTTKSQELQKTDCIQNYALVGSMAHFIHPFIFLRLSWTLRIAV